MKIHVALLDEGTTVWYPVEAVPIADDIFQIVQANDDPDDLKWEFATGARVRCRKQADSREKQILVAYAEIAK